MDTNEMFVYAMTDKFTKNIREHGWGDTVRLYEYIVGRTDSEYVREQLCQAWLNAGRMARR